MQSYLQRAHTYPDPPISYNNTLKGINQPPENTRYRLQSKFNEAISLAKISRGTQHVRSEGKEPSMPPNFFCPFHHGHAFSLQTSCAQDRSSLHALRISRTRPFIHAPTKSLEKVQIHTHEAIQSLATTNTLVPFPTYTPINNCLYPVFCQNLDKTCSAKTTRKPCLGYI